ncbi:hypothetical protein C8Q74DRAFT_1293638 [Fomes fomentarius]|nr:hypothetical protein C8Q74DRAFT_1293638 [Fomes fomentarius]
MLLQSNAHLIGLWLQMVATGAYLVYIPQCVAILRHKMREGLSYWFPALCALIFLITMTDVIVELIRGYHAFSVHGSERPDPAFFFADPATSESMVKNSLTTSLAIISDIIMVYRTLNVCGYHLLVMLVPGSLVLADMVLGIWSIVTLARTHRGESLVIADVSVRVRYFFIVAFVLNSLCAGLICLRVWRVNAELGRLGGKTSTRVFEVVIESAAFYCAYLFVLIITAFVQSNVFFVFLDALPPVTALVFSMLIVRTRTNTKTSDTIELSTTFRFWDTGTPLPESRTTTDLEPADFGTCSEATAANRDDVYPLGRWRSKNSQGNGG